jgi:hypothetical protein
MWKDTFTGIQFIKFSFYRVIIGDNFANYLATTKLRFPSVCAQLCNKGLYKTPLSPSLED